MVGATFYVIKATTTMEAKVGALADVTGTVLRAASGGATISSSTASTSGTSARRLSGAIHGLGDSHARMLSSDHQVHAFHFAPSPSTLRKHAQGLAGVPDAVLRQRRRVSAHRRGLQDETPENLAYSEPAFPGNDDILLGEILPNAENILQEGDGTPVIVEELTTVGGRDAISTIKLFCQLVNEGQDPIQLTMNFAVNGASSDAAPMTVSVSLSDSETTMSGCDSGHKTPWGFSLDYFTVKFPYLFGPGGDGVSPMNYIFSCTSGLVPVDGTMVPGFCSFSQVAMIDSQLPYSQSTESAVLATIDPAQVAQAEAAVLFVNDCSFDIVCSSVMPPEMCSLSSNNCLGPFEPTPGSSSADAILPIFDQDPATRRRLAEDIDAAATVLQTAGIQAAGARVLANKFPEAMLYKSKHVTKSKKARALIAAHNEVKLARRLSFKSPTQAVADLGAYNTNHTQPHLPCMGPKDEDGIRACTLKDLCWTAPGMCLYGPIAPWGAHGGYGSDKLPYLPCTDGDDPMCGLDNAADNFNLGAGLPNSWSGGLLANEATSFSQQDAGAGTERWIGPGARWGSYLMCQPLINDLVMFVNSRVGLGPYVSMDGSTTLPQSSANSKPWSEEDYASAIKTKMLAVYNCWCEKTPTCFSGLDKASPQWFMDNTVSLAALKGGDVISRAYSLGIQIARPPGPGSPEIVDYFYGTLARILDDIPRVAKDTRVLEAVLNGGVSPMPSNFSWAGPEDRTERLKQILELSFNPDSVYTGNAAAGVDTTPFQFTPYGIGSITWQHLVPCCISTSNYVPYGPTAADAADAALADAAALSPDDTAALQSIISIAQGCNADGFPTSEAAWIPSAKGRPQAFSCVMSA